MCGPGPAGHQVNVPWMHGRGAAWRTRHRQNPAGCRRADRCARMLSLHSLSYTAPLRGIGPPQSASLHLLTKLGPAARCLGPSPCFTSAKDRQHAEGTGVVRPAAARCGSARGLHDRLAPLPGRWRQPDRAPQELPRWDGVVQVRRPQLGRGGRIPAPRRRPCAAPSECRTRAIRFLIAHELTVHAAPLGPISRLQR